MYHEQIINLLVNLNATYQIKLNLLLEFILRYYHKF